MALSFRRILFLAESALKYFGSSGKSVPEKPAKKDFDTN